MLNGSETECSEISAGYFRAAKTFMEDVVVIDCVASISLWVTSHSVFKGRLLFYRNKGGVLIMSKRFTTDPYSMIDSNTVPREKGIVQGHVFSLLNVEAAIII